MESPCGRRGWVSQRETRRQRVTSQLGCILVLVYLDECIDNALPWKARAIKKIYTVDNLIGFMTFHELLLCQNNFT